MGRGISKERLAAFQNLEDEKFYSTSDVAQMARFEGSDAQVAQRRRTFYNNLVSHYRKRLGEPDEFVPREGTDYALSPAWLGRKWKKLIE